MTTVLFSILIPISLMVLYRLSLERAWPIDPPRRSNGLNLCAFLLTFASQALAAPGVRLITTALANRFGPAGLAFPDHGLGVIGGFALYLLLMELGEYWFHRAEHVFPWLWSLHSMHHADAEFDSTSAAAHHWLVSVLHAFTVTLALGLLFKIPTSYVLVYIFLSYHVYLMHSNVKLNLGRWSWLVTTPSYHRLHHSSDPQHYNKNYAFILPILDVVFGSYRPAQPGEWPKVGLGEEQEPRGIADLLFWPVRDRIGSKKFALRAPMWARRSP